MICIGLPYTDTSADEFTEPSRLVAIHVYKPASDTALENTVKVLLIVLDLLKFAMLIVLSPSMVVVLKTSNSFLIQLMAGNGEPSKEQVSIRDCGVMKVLAMKLVTTSAGTKN